MPTVDELAQNRQTFGNAPGWSANQRGEPPSNQPSAPPMQPAPSAEDAAAASSAETPPSQTPPSEQATPPPSQPVPEKKPWNLPPEERWEELRKERDAARKAYQDLAGQLARPVALPQPVTPQADPWEGLVNHPDPATAQFYQQQKRLVEHSVQQGREQAYKELSPVLEGIQRGQATMSLKEFRKENPDITPGSEEESLVVAYMEGRVDGIRHPIESARNNAVIKRLESEVQTLKQKQAQTPQKLRAANSESTAGIPPTAGLPPRPGDWREKAGAIIDKGGDMVEVAKTIFGGKRRPLQE